MLKSRSLVSARAALLLALLLPLAIAHGDDAHEAPSPPPPAPAPPSSAPTSYWSYGEHTGLMYMHILLMCLAWAVVLPVGVMLSIARSRLALVAQFAFLLTNAFGLLLGVVYDRKTPDLYENNAHGKIGWAITWVALAWVVMGVIDTYAAKSKATEQFSHPVTEAAMARYQPIHDSELPHPSRWSNDSGQGTEPNSASLCGHSRSPSEHFDSRLPSRQNSFGPQDEDDHDDEDAEKKGFLQNTSVDRFLSRTVPKFAFGRTMKVLRFFYVVLDRTLPLLGFTGIATGTVVYGGIARGSGVFNVLAHYVKGGIFFWYGLLTLGRWMGCFADFGWAWNIKPSREVVGRRKAAIPSAEFTESFVIFLYGVSNVFLEHLAAWGQQWTAQDLEHVSISIMFFGGGLLGMIIESTWMRDLLNTSILASRNSSHLDDQWTAPKTYRFPMNPLPGLIILLLGMMMSGHHQASMLSSMIHKQWGTMFVGFALARAVTYILLYISPPTSYLPSRPPSEIITAFCLVAGGLTFMESNKDTVAALESYNLDAMFTFVITIGLTALVMAWTTVLVAIKGWAVRRHMGSMFAKQSAGALA